MRLFTDLSVRAKLLSAVGLVALATVAVGGLGFWTMTNIAANADDLANQSFQAMKLSDAMDSAAHEAVQLTTQHLYVYDGDLKSEDRVAAELAKLTEGAEQNEEQLSQHLDTPEQRQAFERASAAHDAFLASYKEAVRRSRIETVQGRDDRDWSRSFYVHRVLPAADHADVVRGHLIELLDADAQESADAAQSSAQSSRNIIVVVTAVAVLAAMLLGVLLARRIARGLRELATRLESLSSHCLASLGDGLAAIRGGDLTAEATSVTTPIESYDRDEIGALSETFNETLAKLQAGIESYESMRVQLREMIGEIARTSGTVSAAAEQMASTSSEAGRAVSEIASAIEEVAAGATRQVQMVEEARGQSEETARVAVEARGVADEGVEAAGQASEAMALVRESSSGVNAAIATLAQRSGEIGSIVETITGIAAQTNLLALNAAIEAARAGEQGRGFAVVAEEVRQLAEESQKAAASIGSLIGEMQRETEQTVAVVAEGARRSEDGAAVVERAREAFLRIGESVSDMTVRIEQIAQAAAEVAAVAEQSSASSEQVSASTEETSASTQEIAASSQELAASAEDLKRLVARFTVEA